MSVLVWIEQSKSGALCPTAWEVLGEAASIADELGTSLVPPC